MNGQRMLRRGARRGVVAAVALLAVCAGGLAAASVDETSAAWTDTVSASASVTSGDWQNPRSFGCVAMNSDGTPKAGGTCTVTRTVFDQWGTDALHFRNYYVTIESNAGAGYVQLTLDLNAATMQSNRGTGTWRWGNAAAIVGGELTPTSACSDLPTLVANTGAFWNPSRTFYFPMVDNRSAVGSAAVTCR